MNVFKVADTWVLGSDPVEPGRKMPLRKEGTTPAYSIGCVNVYHLVIDHFYSAWSLGEPGDIPVPEYLTSHMNQNHELLVTSQSSLAADS